MRKLIAAINMTLDGFATTRQGLQMMNYISITVNCYVMRALSYMEG